MGKHSEKADALFTELTNRIAEIVKVKGSKAGFKTAKVVDLDSKSWLHETKSVSGCCIIRYIGETLMYNKYGNEFAFMDLSIDDLAEVVDILEDL